MEVSDEATYSSPTELVANLHQRADALLREFRCYQEHLKLRRKQQEVELRAFKRGIESEVKTLEKLRLVFASPDGCPSASDQQAQSPQLHALRSSNLPFYEAVWDVAKSSHCITSLGKKMHPPRNGCGAQARSGGGNSESQVAEPGDVRKQGVVVDIVARNGLEWIKVSTLTEKRLLFEMAKEGWERYGNASDCNGADGDEDGGQDVEDRPSKLELVRLAEDLRTAAQGTRVLFRHPQIRFVLPKIREGVLADVDAFLADLRATGTVVQCSNEVNNFREPTHLDLDRLMPTSANGPLTPTINVDCTILLALVSDISHLSRDQLRSDAIGKSQPYHRKSQPYHRKSQPYHRAIMSQIEAEESAPILPSEIYPLFANRNLECTSHAAQRMREIVGIMATSSERKRAEVLLGEGHYKDQPASALRQAFGEQSLHHIPQDLRLPVRVIDIDIDGHEVVSSGRDLMAVDARFCQAFPASIAARAKDSLHLTPINASSFLYGWARQITTVTSNRAVASGLLRAINEILDADERQGSGSDAEFVGPLIYTCETARSLIGKAKFK
ncbi:hypothetical protein G647_07686 [Cladophialophora carrionii CBS 160.54]|uniref:DUF1308 domain-containing protein n=1 Tax=Cladophialophora carrionii CBS 160.54 TaxID=1279043 RepID=V9D384_9EURO|nr:uncharacterized protein G647_07686 [Cladophialophora carrionii CBS 160.54]ETI21340.1 hypothetical protein G647_07686 [Cladophialophora carrionii CBS 160.54]